MNASNIVLFDFGPTTGTGEMLKTQLSSMIECVAAIHYRPLIGQDIAETLSAVSAALAALRPDLVILVLSKDAHSVADRIFEALLGNKSAAPILAVPCSEDPDVISEIFQLGASDYLIPPFRRADVQPRLRRLLAYRQTLSTPSSTIKRDLGLGEFVGESPSLLEQIQKIPRMAGYDACVLITGETGTGKEVCARAIHYLSSRSAQAFVPLNCGALPPDLLENELFGHEAGAYTGATSFRVGVLQEADGGTLFLDEVDSLPLSAQVKLLRFLQEKTYRPLGAGKIRKADVRILAASNGNLEELVGQGKVRQDLFYRLNVLSLHLPPLRQRKEDIPLLARHFLAKYCSQSNGAIHDLAPAALCRLALYDWPGNVRELENVIERAVILCAGKTIESRDIDLPARPEPPLKTESFRQLKARVVAEFEQSYLRNLLEQHRGNIAQAARSADKNRRVFFELMRKHHVRVERPAGSSHDSRTVAKIVIVVDKNVQPNTRSHFR